MSRSGPLRIDASRRHLLSANGLPCYLIGDAAWSLLVQLTLDEARHYLQRRADQGFNVLIVNVLEHTYGTRAPRTVEGDLSPFVGEPGLEPENLNEAYFARLDQVLSAAEAVGITLMLAPSYLGYLDAGDGWLGLLEQTSPETCRRYGQWLATRYAERPNIIWMIGGDHDPEHILEQLLAIGEAIHAAMPEALITGHFHPETSPRTALGDPDWLTLDLVYNYERYHSGMTESYVRTPTKPYVMIESSYENEREALPLELRRIAWLPFFYGATGVFMGNRPIWLFDEGWREAIESPLAAQHSVVRALIDRLPWQDYRPDLEHRVLTAGWGGVFNMERAGFAVAEGGALGYFTTPRDLQLDLPRAAEARWLDPRTGEAIAEPTALAAGVQDLRWPDWRETTDLLLELRYSD